MDKFKYILLCAILLCTITTFAQPAQYTPMTAAGYQMKRLKVDSTLHLPSFCGVPTIRGSQVKDGALAIDTCGALLYMWTNQFGWDTVNTSGGDGSQDLQSVLNTGNTSINKDISLYGKSTANEVYISGMDNNFMPFIALGDSIGGGIYQYTYPKATIEFINKYMSQKLKGQDSTRSIIYLPVQTIDATDTLAKLSDVRLASATPTLQQVTTSGAVSTNNITVNGLTLGSLASGLDFTGNTNQLIVSNRGTSDNLLEINYGATGSLKFGGGTYPYVELINNPDNNVGLQVPSTGGTIPISVNGYTANTAGNITIPAGGNDTTKVPYTGANKDVNIGTHDLYTNKVYLLDESNVNYGSIHYTDGDFHVEDADNHKLLVIEDGFMQLHLNDTIQSNIFTTSLTQIRNHTLPDKDGTFAMLSDINGKLNISDTASMLTNYARTNALATKLNISDTASMLTPYARTNAVNVKLNISDTATMLSNYARTNAVNVKLNISDTATMLSNYARTNAVNVKLNISDTATMLSNYARTNAVNVKLNISDTATMLSNYARTNAVNVKLNISDTASMLSPYIRTNVANASIASKVNISDTASMLSPYIRTNVANASLATKLNISDANQTISAFQYLGSSIKFFPIGVSSFIQATTNLQFINTRIFLTAIYVPTTTTVTGVKWITGSAGTAYVGGANYNGIALYSYNVGTGLCTRIDSTASDANTWTTAGFNSKAFVTTASLSQGVYYLAAICNGTATTFPSIVQTLAQSTVTTYDFTSPAKLTGNSAGTVSPASFNLSTITATTNTPVIALY